MSKEFEEALEVARSIATERTCLYVRIDELEGQLRKALFALFDELPAGTILENNSGYPQYLLDEDENWRYEGGRNEVVSPGWVKLVQEDFANQELHIQGRAVV